MHRVSIITLVICLYFGSIISFLEAKSKIEPANIIVATKNSSEASKAQADIIADGLGDQEEINRAIQELPSIGGKVVLMEGTYDIRHVEGTWGGIIINRSNVVLSGQGASTKLVLANNQNTNVIRIIGDGVGNITIRDLYIDANNKNNKKHYEPDFEACGINALRANHGDWKGRHIHDLTVENTYIYNANALNLMLAGENIKVLNNFVGNSGSDNIEVLKGPAEIRGNTVTVTETSGGGIGTDAASSVIISGNNIHVTEKGLLSNGYYTWQYQAWVEVSRLVVSNNILTIDPGGIVKRAMDIRSPNSVVSNNVLHGFETNVKPTLSVVGTNVIISGNLLINIDIEIDSNRFQTPEGEIFLSNNFLKNTRIVAKTNNLIKNSNFIDTNLEKMNGDIVTTKSVKENSNALDAELMKQKFTFPLHVIIILLLAIIIILGIKIIFK